MSKKLHKPRVCHLTTAHPRFDNRIFAKECISLSKAGFEVILLVGDGKGSAIESGVNIYDLGLYTKTLKRIFLAPFIFTFMALKKKASIYHFHDPELIITGLTLRMLGKKVIYDIHEDYATSIIHRDYIPRPLKKVASYFWLAFENTISVLLHQIIAEKYYQHRFPKAIQILNYPIISAQSPKKNHGIGETLIYTGNISEERGALIHTEILNYTDEINILMVGYCSRITRNKIRSTTNKKINQLNVIGVDSYISYSDIKKKYEQDSFLCGLAIFPESLHFREKELTKFFEYMQYGIPIICSNFPVWKNLIEGNKCGISVNPYSKDDIHTAIIFLKENPIKAKEMGQNGIKAVKNQFNWGIESEKLIDLYKTLID
jgi:glycosyltransferase involved in cell wall biosynthesis